jgi:DnaJ-class molecular chaperone
LETEAASESQGEEAAATSTAQAQPETVDEAATKADEGGPERTLVPQQQDSEFDSLASIMAAIDASSDSASSDSEDDLSSDEEQEQEQQEVEDEELSTTTLTIRCPEASLAGDSIFVQTDDGEIEVTIPEGVEPGEEFDLEISGEEGGGGEAGSDEEEEAEGEDGAGSDDSATLTITCPAETSPGDSIFIQTEDGELEIQVPEGVAPGEEFDITVE